LKKKKRGENILGYCLMAPWIFGFVIMFLIPMIMSLCYSLTDYNLLSPPTFVGIKNYIRLFTADPSFWQSLGVTFLYVAVLVPLRLAFSLAIAMLLNSKRRGVGLYRTMYYLPSMIGGSLAVAIVWKQIFGNKGVVMSILNAIGIEQKMSLIGNPSTALWTLVLLGVWQFGSSMLIFLAALKQVPGEIYESAILDGASPWKKFTKITLPMISPTIFFNLVLQIINGFRAFTESYVVTNGGPLDKTLFYVLNMYRRTFTYFEMGYGSAMAWVLVVIIAVFAGIAFKTQSSWVHYEAKER